jgi:ATP-dependent Lhr-like helicase
MWNPTLRVWGLSATLGHLDEARAVLLPNAPAAPLITADVHKEIVVETLIPATLERFPWAGHIGLKLLPEVLNLLRTADSTILFTNTRAQTEIWFQALVDHAHDLIGATALHHGSLERALRSEVEDRLRDGRLRVVVSTSSLDLGVDFSPVDQVIQVGSPKGIARLLQRAGRSGHRPGAASVIRCVPTHAFELVEFAAVKRALHGAPGGHPDVEARTPIAKPLDVLVQHLVTIALGGGFRSADLLAEVRTSWAYRDLTDAEWQWAIDFVTHGGAALGAYDQFTKVVEREGIFTVESREIARFHRMSIGSITSAASMKVAFLKGASLGTIEESFISRLRMGDRFIFAGRILELIMVRDMTAYVRKATSARGIVPRWAGGRMPLSTQLAAAVRAELDAARRGIYEGPEMEAVRPLLELQQRWSRLPEPGALLIERTHTRDGHHLFLFPLAGRLVHEGLAALLSYRIARSAPRTVNAFATDYGVELLSPAPFTADTAAWRQWLSTDMLIDDILACVNSSELARRQFRDIARIAGLIFSGYPGSGKSTRQLQASSGILFDVFSTYDPDNLLIDQARREVLHDQLEVARLRTLLEAIATQELCFVETKRLTPLAFPLWADSLRAQEVTTEKWEDRIKRMVVQLEADAGGF